MGCDIHIVPERLVDGNWEPVEPLKLSKWWYERIIDEVIDEDFDDEFTYEDLEKKYESMTEEDIIAMFGNDPRISWEGPWDSDYDLRGRNYNWFSILANVRNGYGFAGCDTGDGFVPIAIPRGLPDDVSPETKTLSDSWGEDGHSHSHVILQELLDYDWDNQTTKQRGMVSAMGFKEFKEKGKPSSWCGGAWGTETVTVDNTTMSQIINGCYGINGSEQKHYYTTVEWDESYRDAVGEQYIQKILDKLSEYGKPNEVRIVFWFDN